MKFVNEILGFVTLTAPLWLILILLVVGVAVALIVVRRVVGHKLRLVIGILLAALIVVLPFADEFAGRLVLSGLCNSEAGISVYETVALPREYWDAKGNPKFERRDGSIDKTVLPGYSAMVTNQRIDSLFPIFRFRFAYQLDSNKKILGEFVDFRYSGGWIVRSLSIAPASGASCNRRESPDARLIMQIFGPAEDR